jgi:hypothetical protein
LRFLFSSFFEEMDWEEGAAVAGELVCLAMQKL